MPPPARTSARSRSTGITASNSSRATPQPRPNSSAPPTSTRPPVQPPPCWATTWARPAPIARASFFADAPTLIGGGGADGSTNVSIIPYLMGGTATIRRRVRLCDLWGQRGASPDGQRIRPFARPSRPEDNVNVTASESLSASQTINSLLSPLPPTPRLKLAQVIPSTSPAAPLLSRADMVPSPMARSSSAATPAIFPTPSAALPRSTVSSTVPTASSSPAVVPSSVAPIPLLEPSMSTADSPPRIPPPSAMRATGSFSMAPIPRSVSPRTSPSPITSRCRGRTIPFTPTAITLSPAISR